MNETVDENERLGANVSWILAGARLHPYSSSLRPLELYDTFEFLRRNVLGGQCNRAVLVEIPHLSLQLRPKRKMSNRTPSFDHVLQARRRSRAGSCVIRLKLEVNVLNL